MATSTTTTQVETVSTTADKAKLAAAVLLLIGGLVAFYLLQAQGVWVQWGGLVAGLVLAVVLFFSAESGRQLVAFTRDSYREVGKVVWPSRKEATQMTLYVFGFVAIMAVFLWLTDKTLEWVFFDLILGWRK